MRDGEIERQTETNRDKMRERETEIDRKNTERQKQREIK